MNPLRCACFLFLFYPLICSSKEQQVASNDFSASAKAEENVTNRVAALFNIEKQIDSAQGLVARNHTHSQARTAPQSSLDLGLPPIYYGSGDIIVHYCNNDTCIVNEHKCQESLAGMRIAARAPRPSDAPINRATRPLISPDFDEKYRARRNWFWVRHYDDQQDTFAFRLFRPWTKYPPVDPGYEVDPTLVWPIQFIIPPWALERFLKASVLRRGAAKRDQLRLRELVDSSQVPTDITDVLHDVWLNCFGCDGRMAMLRYRLMRFSGLDLGPVQAYEELIALELLIQKLDPQYERVKLSLRDVLNRLYPISQLGEVFSRYAEDLKRDKFATLQARIILANTMRQKIGLWNVSQRALAGLYDPNQDKWSAYPPDT